MKNKLVSLVDLTKMTEDEILSEKYVRYISGISDDNEYRHQEMRDIDKLIKILAVEDICLSDFIYSYKIPNFSKEFDLIKVTENQCLNIELKSDNIPESKLLRQLIQNKHYLSMLGKEVKLFSFISSEQKIYYLNSNDCLTESNFDELRECIRLTNTVYVDLDSIFAPGHVLTSPLNSPERFLRGEYFLTDQQQSIKDKIIKYIKSNSAERFVALTGGPGTGKTLLTYDIAKELSEYGKVLIVHSGIMCDGQNVINSKTNRIHIIGAKEITYRAEFSGSEFMVVDESHRLYKPTLETVVNWVKAHKTTCIFSFDDSQKLSAYEDRINNSGTILKLCGDNKYKLSDKIRTNKEIALFIKCLFNLKKINLIM